MGKEFCWEGNDRDASSPMSSNVDAVEIVRSSGKPIGQVANELGIYDSTLGNWVRQDGINRGRKRRVTTTADTAHRIPDLLRGDFTTSAPDEAWVGDITYIRTRQGFLYLAFVLDLASRRVLGVSIASHMKTSLVADALREAIGTRGSQVQGVVFHTDRGSQTIHYE